MARTKTPMHMRLNNRRAQERLERFREMGIISSFPEEEGSTSGAREASSDESPPRSTIKLINMSERPLQSSPNEFIEEQPSSSNEFIEEPPSLQDEEQDEEMDRLQKKIQELDEEVEKLKRENHRLKVELRRLSPSVSDVEKPMKMLKLTHQKSE